MQGVFQYPWSSLNPRMRVRDLIAEPMVINWQISKSEIQERVLQLLQEVGLSSYHANLYPHEFSGGQRQRLAIARALSLNPKIIVLDEPVSALDVSIRAQIMNLLKDLQEEYQVSYLLVTHNLSTIRYMAHNTAVMYLGRIVESGPVKQVLHSPAHPYTRSLLNSLPKLDALDEPLTPIPGDIPSPLERPPGCVFHTRCPEAIVCLLYTSDAADE